MRSVAAMAAPSASASASSAAAAACATGGAARGVASLAARAKTKGEVRMRVVLRRTSELGAAHSVIAVRRGHGRNVLIRSGEADYATAENLHRAALRAQAEQEENLRRVQEEAEKEQKEAEANKDKNGNAAGGKKAAAAADAAAANAAVAAAQEGAQAAAAAASTSQSSASSYLTQLLSKDPSYVSAIARRLRAQPPLLVHAEPASAAGGRESADRLADPVTLRDVYLRLAVQHPSLSMRQLSFGQPKSVASGAVVAAPESLTTFGQHELLVRLPGLPEPVSVGVNVAKPKAKLTVPLPATSAAAASKRF
jgi:ribosomal protein L9